MLEPSARSVVEVNLHGSYWMAQACGRVMQPGSSIMPGKVNPVLPEATTQVAAQVIGNDAAIAWGGAAGAFELNVYIPVMARNLLESFTLLANVSRLFAER